MGFAHNDQRLRPNSDRDKYVHRNTESDADEYGDGYEHVDIHADQFGNKYAKLDADGKSYLHKRFI